MVFNFKDTETVFLLIHRRLQVRWRSLEEKKRLFPLVKHLLVPSEREILQITPLHQLKQIIHGGKRVKTYWCDEEIDYVKTDPFAVARKWRELCNRLNFLLNQSPHRMIDTESLVEMPNHVTVEEGLDILKRMILVYGHKSFRS